MVLRQYDIDSFNQYAFEVFEIKAISGIDEDDKYFGRFSLLDIGTDNEQFEDLAFEWEID